MKHTGKCLTAFALLEFRGCFILQDYVTLLSSTSYPLIVGPRIYIVLKNPSQFGLSCWDPRRATLLLYCMTRAPFQLSRCTVVVLKGGKKKKDSDYMLILLKIPLLLKAVKLTKFWEMMLMLHLESNT